jgi:hypothetical protein
MTATLPLVAVHGRRLDPGYHAAGRQAGPGGAPETKSRRSPGSVIAVGGSVRWFPNPL